MQSILTVLNASPPHQRTGLYISEIPSFPLISESHSAQNIEIFQIAGSNSCGSWSGKRELELCPHECTTLGIGCNLRQPQSQSQSSKHTSPTHSTYCVVVSSKAADSRYKNPGGNRRRRVKEDLGNREMECLCTAGLIKCIFCQKAKHFKSVEGRTTDWTLHLMALVMKRQLKSTTAAKDWAHVKQHILISRCLSGS